MELISREEAMEAIRAIKEVMLANGEVINALYNVPTVESRPKGEWEASVNGTDYRVCSECGYERHAGTKYNYCPICGADMRGKE